MRSTKAIIHLENLKSNIRQIKSLTKKDTLFLCPVKANAYGHGTVECARAALEAGADYLSVATTEEGILLRENGIKAPVLLFSLCSIDEVEDCVRYRITPFAFDEEYIMMFEDACARAHVKNFPIHLAIDTGMGRIGCYPEEAGELAKVISSSKHLFLEGICTHLAVSDSAEPENIKYTQEQKNRFLQAVENVRKAGINPKICHIANSAATLALPDFHFDMIRPGIIIYGYYADQINKEYLEKKGIKIDLKPVMTLETEICSIRHFKKGMSVGYGRSWTCDQDTDIAVLPIGYGDGFLRRNSKAGIQVAINGKNYPVRGRICMDQCMVDIGLNSGIKRWDRAVIFGTKEDGALQDANDVANMTDTISYEVTTSVSERVPRIYTDVD